MRHLFLSTAVVTATAVGLPAALQAAGSDSQATAAQRGAADISPATARQTAGGQQLAAADRQDASGDVAGTAMRQDTLISALEEAGFSGIAIVDATYLVRAETQDGERVVMVLDPPRTTADAGEANGAQQQRQAGAGQAQDEAGQQHRARQDETQQAAQQSGGSSQTGVTEELGERYRSFERAGMARDQWVVGELTAEDLLDKEVVDPSGEVIGTSSDLLVDETDRVRAVLIDIGDGSHMAIAVDRLELEQGGSGQLVSNVSPAEIEAQPRYQIEELDWYRTVY